MKAVQRVIWGIRWGAVFGGALALLALLAFFIRGSAAFDRLNTTMPTVVVVDLLGSVVAGMIVGLLLPLVRTAGGAGPLRRPS